MDMHEWGALVAVKHNWRISPGPAYGAALERLVERGLVDRDADGKPRLTPTGMAAWEAGR